MPPTLFFPFNSAICVTPPWQGLQMSCQPYLHRMCAHQRYTGRCLARATGFAAASAPLRAPCTKSPSCTWRWRQPVPNNFLTSWSERITSNSVQLLNTKQILASYSLKTTHLPWLTSETLGLNYWVKLLYNYTKKFENFNMMYVKWLNIHLIKYEGSTQYSLNKQ